LVGGYHRRVLPVAALLGAALVSVADTVGRSLIAPGQIPAGLGTALLGAPYFLWLLWRPRNPIRGCADGRGVRRHDRTGRDPHLRRRGGGRRTERPAHEAAHRRRRGPGPVRAQGPRPVHVSAAPSPRPRGADGRHRLQ